MTSTRSTSHSNCIQISIKIPPSRLTPPCNEMITGPRLGFHKTSITAKILGALHTEEMINNEIEFIEKCYKCDE